MADRPYTLLSCGISIDGYLDSTDAARLRLSNAADFDRVDAERARCDAILVGATTIRNDNPRLLVRSAARRAERVSRGLPASPAKVTLTRRGDLPATAAFFTRGDSDKIVYCPAPSRTTSGLGWVRSRPSSTRAQLDASTWQESWSTSRPEGSIE